MDWTTFAAGAFVGFLLADVLWRILHGLAIKLVNEQRTLINELLGRRQ